MIAHLPPASLRRQVPVSQLTFAERTARFAKLRTSYAPGDVIAGKYQLKRSVSVDVAESSWVARSVSGYVSVRILEADTQSRTDADMLLAEARAASEIEDAPVGRILDCGSTRNRDIFLVTDLLYGESLRDVVDEHGRIPPIQAVKRLLPVLDALGAAHATGLLHHDVRPENVFFARHADGREETLLVGFGVRRILEARGVACDVSYDAPERARGLDVDPRADLWSFMATLYEAISGERPFLARRDRTLLRAIVQDEPIDLVAEGLVDRPLGYLLEQGLAKRRDMRAPTASSLRSGLYAWLAFRAPSLLPT